MTDLPYIIAEPNIVDGIPYQGVVKEETLRILPDSQVYEDDVYIAGYQKSGTNWVALAVEAILRADDLQNLVANGSTYIPVPLEFESGYQQYLTISRPRITHTNLRFRYLPKGVREGKAKVVHISRNPRDVAISYYHFTKMCTLYGPFTGTWDDFFQAFMDGRVARGRWYDYMIDWMKHRDEDNKLFIKYEDFYENPQKMVEKISAFLGRILTDETVKKIAELVSFKSRKDNAKLDVRAGDIFRGEFLRKGIVGDWVNYFTAEQERIMDEMYKKFESGTGVSFSFK